MTVSNSPRLYTAETLQQAQNGGDLAFMNDSITRWIPQTDSDREEFAQWKDGIDFMADMLSFLKEMMDKPTPTPESKKETCTIIAKVFAEAAKIEDTRDPIAAHGTITSLLALLDDRPLDATPAETELTIQILRALANLCYDNDANRELVLCSPGGIAGLATCLRSTDLKVVITTCGALTNISMDNEPVQTEMVAAGVLPILLNILKANIDMSMDIEVLETATTPAIRVISNLSESDRGFQELLTTDGITTLFQLLRYKHQIILSPECSADRFHGAIEVLDALTTVLEAIMEKDEIQRAIVSRGLLEHILDFVDHRPRTWPQDTDEEDVVAYHEVRRTVSRMATLVTMNDANMVDILKNAHVLEQFQRWMQNGTGGTDVAEEDEIRMAGALAIGNLSRSDETCIALIRDYGVAQSLLELLRLEISRANAPGPDGKSIIKVVHAVVGALKNLSLAVGNRVILGSLGVVTRVAEMLEAQGVKPVHYMGVGVLKNLCAGTGNDANVYRLITGQEPPSTEGSLGDWAAVSTSPASPAGKTPLSRVISLIWSATGDNDTGTRNEGGRLMVNLVRACHRGQAFPLLKMLVDGKAIVPLIQIITGALLTRPRTVTDDDGDVSHEEDHHVHFDAVPMEGQVFPMVQNEGMIALVLITNAYPEATAIITKYAASLVPTFLNILNSGLVPPDPTEEGQPLAEPAHVYPAAAKANVCVLLQALVEAEESFKARVLEASLKPTLQTLSTNARTPIQSPTASSASLVTDSTPTPIAPASRALGTAALGRTGTMSARSGLQGTGPRSRSELEGVFGAAAGVPAEGALEGASLRQAAVALLMVL